MSMKGGYFSVCYTLQGMYHNGQFGVLHCPLYSGAEIREILVLKFRAFSFNFVTYEYL